MCLETHANQHLSLCITHNGLNSIFTYCQNVSIKKYKYLVGKKIADKFHYIYNIHFSVKWFYEKGALISCS